VSWDFDVTTPGVFELQLELACQKENAGSEYEVEIVGQKFRGSVEDTGGWYQFVTHKLGQVTINRAGKQTLTVRPLTMPNGAVMNLRSVALRPINKQKDSQ